MGKSAGGESIQKAMSEYILCLPVLTVRAGATGRATRQILDMIEANGGQRGWTCQKGTSEGST